MSQHHFLVGTGRVSARTAKRIDQICHRHGADFVAVVLPDGPRYWASCPSMGHPFDRATRDAVVADLESADLYPVPTK